MIIGSRIREQLSARGISQSALARRVGLDPSTINGLVNGEQLSSTKLHLIAAELGTSTAYLTGETDDPEGESASSHISAEDWELLRLVHDIDSSERKALMTIIRSMAKPTERPTLHAPQREYRAA